MSKNLPLPAKINLGSGKNFRPDYLNIDSDDQDTPDIVADISELVAGKAFATRRFGKVKLAADSFEEIIATGVLETTEDLAESMTNCLNLLKPEGMLRVVVPYDLSYGAWQNPSHVRAFNERSWIYYTDWFWSLGWTTHRFMLRQLEFVLSPSGEVMQKAGAQKQVILNTPRAIDAMKVGLEKVMLSDQDKATLKLQTEKRASSS